MFAAILREDAKKIIPTQPEYIEDSSKHTKYDTR
jgi:hypothetical protein